MERVQHFGVKFTRLQSQAELLQESLPVELQQKDQLFATLIQREKVNKSLQKESAAEK